MHNDPQQTIKMLVEQVFGIQIHAPCAAWNLLNIDAQVMPDDMSILHCYLQDPLLVTQDLKSKLVAEQLKKYAGAINKYDPLTTNLPPAANWAEYVAKLEDQLAQVKYRRQHNYEYHKVMPAAQIIQQLQAECWRLTEQYYGYGNLACFYIYFIEMTEHAGVTSFIYTEISKNISADQYISRVNINERNKYYTAYEQDHHQAYLAQGGYWAQGRSVIDGTAISNVFYYKSALKLFCHLYAKHLTVTALNLEDYGQVPYAQRVALWQQICQHFPDDTAADLNNIFYQYAKFVNEIPGEYFNHLGADLPAVKQPSPDQFHDLVKAAGLQGGQLIILPRNEVADLITRRFMHIHWQRKHQLNSSSEPSTCIRSANVTEQVRIWPNTIPYTRDHGLLLCGNCLPDDPAIFDAVTWQWNSPVDTQEVYDNAVHDIEKLFRELKLLCPPNDQTKLQSGEQFVYIFQNTLGYSTVPQTQHAHAARGTIEEFPVYMWPASAKTFAATLNARVEIVQIGHQLDACYLRVHFTDLDNDRLLKFLIDFNQAIFAHFGGTKHFDVYIHISVNLQGEYVFIYEPHVRLLGAENFKFFNPEINAISPRKPQYFIPHGGEITLFDADVEFAGGLAYLRKFFDLTCKQGVHKFINEYLAKVV
jgi:hypothetical protein